MSTKHNWYVGKTGNHQGLIIEEGTGESIAVAYDKDNAPLLAAAPELLRFIEVIAGMSRSDDAEDSISTINRLIHEAQCLICDKELQ